LFEKLGNWNADFYSTAALALLSGILILVVRAMPLPGQGSEGAEPVMVVAKVS
jgi:hypothetical protein